MKLSIDQIAKATGCPAANVSLIWPLVEGCLEDMGIGSDNVYIAAAATIAVETAHKFLPLDEYGGPDYWKKMYDVEGSRPDLARANGNTEPGDGVKFHGRGLVQTTWKNNYMRGGKMIGVDLIADPSKAKEPHNAAALLVAFFWDHHEADAVNAGDWTKARKIVNGGTNGLQDFLKCVHALQDAMKGEACCS